MRIIALIVGMLIAARPADACGEWAMTDKEKNRVISYLINSAQVLAGTKRIGAFYLDIESKQAKQDGMRTVRERKVQFDIKDGKLRKFGKVVASIDGSSITFGKKTYTIELTNEHKYMDALPAWDLAVKRGDQLIIESTEATALCSAMHKDMTLEKQQDEVRRRVMFYLAWREVGG